MSFTNFSGDIYSGTIPLIELKFQDFFTCFIPPSVKFTSNITQFIQNTQNSTKIQFSETESFKLFCYHYLQEKYCKHESFKILRQPSNIVLERFISCLKHFQVHAPYDISDKDDLSTDYKNFIFAQTHPRKVSQLSTLKFISQQHTILRVIISLPAKNYLLMHFKIKKSQSEINIYTTRSDVFKYLDEYFNIWLVWSIFHT